LEKFHILAEVTVRVTWWPLVMALFDRPQCGFLLVFCCYCVSALTISISKIVPSVLLLLTMISLVSDIAIFVLKRDVKLQPTNLP